MTRLNLTTRRMRALFLAILLIFITAPSLSAQHHKHDHPAETAPTPAATPSPSPTPTPTPVKPEGRSQDEESGGATASTPQSAEMIDHSRHNVGAGDESKAGTSGGAASLIPMGKMGSGTSWQPASSPAHMLHSRIGDWHLMYHGEAKIGVNSQGGPRGTTKLESQNWFMPMAFRRVGKGTLTLRGMFSLEPLTYSGAGSPQLLQTGEVYKGKAIVDAQHPHDFLMELSAQYTVPLGEKGSWYAYVGYPGEPALGPPAFMHRPSASENPSAPLAHHFQDSTHISFGVLTTGFTYRWFKVEGSIFNGREPDDRRWGFEAGKWNSRSARFTVAPNENWAIQVSYGLLKNPELLHDGDTRRITASVQYNRPFKRGNWATALIWGRNKEEHGGHTFKLNGYTVESTLNFLSKNYVYTRLELVDRKDMLSEEELVRLGFGRHAHPQFRVGAYTFGYARDLWKTEKYSVALGGDTTFYSKPEVLDSVYGKNPTSYKVFLRFRLGGGSGGHDGH